MDEFRKAGMMDAPEYSVLMMTLYRMGLEIEQEKYGEAKIKLEEAEKWLNILDDKDFKEKVKQLKVLLGKKNKIESSSLGAYLLKRVKNNEVRKIFNRKMIEFRKKQPEIVGNEEAKKLSRDNMWRRRK